jgi:Mn-dependent DtxR family transcriptional regulator
MDYREMYNDTIALLLAYYQGSTNSENIMRMMAIHELFVIAIEGEDTHMAERMALRITHHFETTLTY